MRVIQFILETTKPYRKYIWGMFFAICIVSLDTNIKPYIVKRLIDAAIFTANYQFVQCALTALIALVLIANVHVLFAVGLLLWMVTFFVIVYAGFKKVTALTAAYAESKSAVFGHLSDYLTNMLNVKLFSTSSFEMKRFQNASKNYVKQSQAQGYFLMKFYVLQGAVFSAYTIGFLLFLVHLHNCNVISPGDFALVFMVNFRIVGKLFELSHQLRDFITNWGSVDQALTLLKEAPEIQDAPSAGELVVNKGKIV